MKRVLLVLQKSEEGRGQLAKTTHAGFHEKGTMSQGWNQGGSKSHAGLIPGFVLNGVCLTGFPS